MALATIGYAFLLAAFWFVGVYFGVSDKLGPHPIPTALSFALLITPYWFFGFGAGDWLGAKLTRPATRVAASACFILPYLAFSIPRSEFSPGICAGLIAAMVGLTALLEFVPSVWADYAVLAIVAVIIERHVFAAAWPIPGLSGLEKLLFVDVVLYGYLVVRRRPEIGFDLRPRKSDFAVGVREFLFYTPIALTLGFALNFLHLHGTVGTLQSFAAAWIFTLFFVALPEEIFFRGILLNVLARQMRERTAIIASSVLFGLAHFNKRAVFNWRYVILACIAGIFYARSYLANRRILSAGVTHATVDTVWSIWLK